MAIKRAFPGVLLVLGVILPVLAAQAQAVRVEVTEADCRKLVRHLPAGDVAYRAGRDVYGREVAPADLGGGVQLDLPRVYSFDIDIQPIAFADRRRIEAERQALAVDLQDNAAVGQLLGDEAAVLADREAAIQATFEAASAAIIAATGGPGETNATVLATRTARLDALRVNTLTGPDFIDLQEDLARNREAQALNLADSQALLERRARLDEDAAAISRRGLDATTMTVGRVTLDLDTGRARFNGQPLQDEAQADLIALCREALAAAR